jgi:hypothetical protein
VLKGYKHRREEDIAKLRLGAILSRWPTNKYLPTMDQLLKPDQVKEPQSPDQMVSALDSWVRATGQVN